MCLVEDLDRRRTFARNAGDFNAFVIGTEAGMLVNEDPGNEGNGLNRDELERRRRKPDPARPPTGILLPWHERFAAWMGWGQELLPCRRARNSWPASGHSWNTW